MNKRKLHHTLALLRKIHYSVLLGLCLIFAVTSVLALRANNQRMVELRAAVFKADKDNGDIEGSLRSLRTYVFAHMNTNLSSGFSAVKPPIQLKYHYERLVGAAEAEYTKKNTEMVNTAEATCIAQYPGTVFSQPRLQCAKTYALEHPVKRRTIPDHMYKFDFSSPTWSPDLAGWGMVAAGVFLALFILRYLSERAIRHELRS